jgi:hypothetical protein
MTDLAPIALFVYNRIEHTKQTIESLKRNNLAKESELYIFSDSAKDAYSQAKVDEVRSYIKKIDGFKKLYIIQRKQNFGLAKSIISGVNELINKFGKIIVIEDDLQLSSDFLEYMNKALNVYENHRDIFSISGYTAPINIPDNYKYDIFLFQRINSWGWASWKDRWNTVDWEMSDFKHFIQNKQIRKKFEQGGEDLSIMLLKQYLGKIDSWAIRFNYACFKQKKYNIYPVGSKVLNLGADGSGVNLGKTQKYKNILNEKPVKFLKDIQPNNDIVKSYRDFFKVSLFRKTINFFKIYGYLFCLKTCKMKNIIIFAVY